MLFRSLLDGGESRAVNLGTGCGASVREVVETCARVIGRAPKCRHADRRAGDPRALVANCDLARELLGWRPRMSDLETIIETANRWETRCRIAEKSRDRP